MISFEKVRKTYPTKAGRRVILEQLDLNLDTGVNLGILGLNGAGKSTFLRLVSGIELPDRGHIRRQARVSFPLGYSGSFVHNLSGRENVSFIARIYGLDPASLARFVDDFAELGRYFDEPIRTYSSGMRARLGFAVSIGIDFDVYLIDEATAAGDARFAARCETALAERRKNRHFIMVSHQRGELSSYCQAGAVLHNGRLRVFPTLDEAYVAYARIVADPDGVG
jgi:capsular polysaccharide transport system ATP-binding protein